MLVEKRETVMPCLFASLRAAVKPSVDAITHTFVAAELSADTNFVEA